jgi:hypothetical protein
MARGIHGPFYNMRVGHPRNGLTTVSGVALQAPCGCPLPPWIPHAWVGGGIDMTEQSRRISRR